MSTARRIIKVFPDDRFNRLVLFFSDNTIFDFDPSKLPYNKRSIVEGRRNYFLLGENSLLWHNKSSNEDLELSFDFLRSNSKQIQYRNLCNRRIKLGQRNQAPTEKHKKHHVYALTMHPFLKQIQFDLIQSIGGGHGDSGFQKSLTLGQIFEYPGWEAHFELCGCSWAKEILVQYKKTPENLIDKIVTTFLSLKHAT